MFDQLRNTYALRCPETGTTSATTVSAFRTVRRLRGASAPAIFRVVFDCTSCGGRHETLVPHDQLDWEPLGTQSTETWTDLLTGRRRLVADDLLELATRQLRRGSWPWTFWCHPESALRPGFPSSLRFITPEHGFGDEHVGVLVRCFSCARHTVNIVSRDHLDVPWHTDDRIAYVSQVFDGDDLAPEERFRHQLHDGTMRWLRAG